MNINQSINEVETTRSDLSRWMGRVKKVHFVGIGGAGMNGIAEVLVGLGYSISGSDQNNSRVIQRLKRLGVNIFIGHKGVQVEDADVVVKSTAIREENPEIVAAHKSNIPVIPRAEMLAELMRFRFGIAVSGTHGKTTTTSLIASVLAEAGLDPTYVIGGKLTKSESNARLGSGKYLVAEADESDASFLHLQPMMAVVTNIDKDHLSTYAGDFESLKKTFYDFVHNLPFYGLVVICLDDKNTEEVMKEIPRPLLTYGFSEDADIRAINVETSGSRSKYTVISKISNCQYDVLLNMAGKHNIQNSLAAIAVASEIGISTEKIIKGLGEFQGITRRFEMLGELILEQGAVEVVDDYAHHPSEIRAVFQALSCHWPNRRFVVVFQPHRFSRTYELFDDFVKVLSEADLLLMLNVYAAGEQPINGADTRSLCAAIRTRGVVNPIYVDDDTELEDTLRKVLKHGDVLVMLGAGNIGQYARQIVGVIEQ